MLQIDHTIISRELLEQRFVCDLHACKGACCVEGDEGAPLEKEELEKLQAVYEDVKPYLRKEGIQAIREQGLYTIDREGDYVTPLVEGKECAYAFFEKDGTAKCAIEKAHREGKTDFKKPISCHLYPVRINKHKDFEAVNYARWEICNPACACGEQLNVKVYRFLKEALIRKYGEEWYKQLEYADQHLNTSKGQAP